MAERTKTFLEDLDQMVGSRQVAAYRRVFRDPRHAECREQISALEEQFKAKIGPEAWRDYMALENAGTERGCIEIDEYYIQGFRDGVALVMLLTDPRDRSFDRMVREARRTVNDEGGSPVTG